VAGLTPPGGLRKIRVAIGLLSTAESLDWIGREAGIFARNGIDLDIVRSQTTGPVAAAGLNDGEWDCADVGSQPIVECYLRGVDSIVLLAAEPIGATFLVTRRDVADKSQLAGGRVGVLSTGGQTEFSAIAILRKWGMLDRVALVNLGTAPRIYEALARGEIEGGIFTADHRFLGERQHGMRVLADIGHEFSFLGPCIATSRRFIAADRDLAKRLVRAYVETIHYFKTRGDDVVPMLGRYLSIDDRAVVVDIHRYYADRFQAAPRPPAASLQRLIDSYKDKYPAAASMTPADVTDDSLLDELEREGVLARLYGR
jgi:ABC-type nitrate/sulfonate/bicarbonate transport system substrate-binding protein